MLRRCLVSGVCFSILTVLVATSALGQSEIFVTPIPNAPFRGEVEVERSFVQKNGTVMNFKTTRVIARDNAGRIYIESRSMVPVSSTATPLLLRVHIYDPQTRVSTMLFPRQQMYRSFVVNRPPSTDPPGQLEASAAGANLPLSQYSKQEDLGTKEMDGFQVHGVRVTQTIPASHGGQPVIVTDEYWYSDYLHLNVVMKHDDPRTGSMTSTLTQVSQEDPDASMFTIPDGYKPFSMMRSRYSK